MKILLAIFLMFILTSCKNSGKQSAESVSESKNESDDKLTIEYLKEYKDEKWNPRNWEEYFDTVNIKSAPIRIESAIIGEQNNVLDREVVISYKNISDKIIEAVKFRWYSVDAFGELDVLIENEQFDLPESRDDDRVLPGSIKKFTEWRYISRSTKKVANIWPYEVAFSDGSIWRVSVE